MTVSKEDFKAALKEALQDPEVVELIQSRIKKAPGEFPLPWRQ